MGPIISTSARFSSNLYAMLAGCEIRTYQHVRWFIEGHERVLRHRFWIECCVPLHRTIDEEVRIEMSGEVDRFLDALRSQST